MPETEVVIRYEFEDRFARQIVTNPATGREWVIPMRLNGAWREDIAVKSEDGKETTRTVSSTGDQ